MFLCSALFLMPLSPASRPLAQSPPAPPPVARIAVVKTWQDLQGQPALDLGGVRIQLGIEADSAPRWSGVLLYGLTEGYVPPTCWKGDPLGPVQVSYQFEQERPRRGEVRSGARTRERLPPSGARLLFTQALFLDRVGSYTVRILGPQGRLVATCTLRGTAGPFHPWMPWGQSNGGEALNNELNEIALPFFCPTRYRVIPKGTPEYEAMRRKEKLPTLLPANPDPWFRIRVKGRELLLECDAKMVVTRPHSRFLVRWWINGKPFVPRQASEIRDEMFHELIQEDQELTLALEVDPRRFRAAKGDRIGLQILYCGDGWSWCLPRAEHRAAWGRGEVRLSNRVEFVSDGDG
jgi:hypothetical protein